MDHTNTDITAGVRHGIEGLLGGLIILVGTFTLGYIFGENAQKEECANKRCNCTCKMNIVQPQRMGYRH
jgi:hypothetical protein